MKLPLPQIQEGRGLTNWVTASLREAILKGYFDVGEKLDQDRIAEELKVSRTPIREALKVLESEGFVDIRSYRGAYISQVTRQDVQDVYEVRTLIEVEVVRQATPLVPVSVLDEIEKLMDADENALGEGKVGNHYGSDAFFHATILSYTSNKLFREILDNLNNRILRVRYFALRQPGNHLRVSHDEHRCILQAMRKGDAEAASEAMRVHLQNSSIRIGAFLR